MSKTRKLTHIQLTFWVSVFFAIITTLTIQTVNAEEGVANTADSIKPVPTLYNKEPVRIDDRLRETAQEVKDTFRAEEAIDKQEVMPVRAMMEEKKEVMVKEREEMMRTQELDKEKMVEQRVEMRDEMKDKMMNATPEEKSEITKEMTEKRADIKEDFIEKRQENIENTKEEVAQKREEAQKMREEKKAELSENAKDRLEAYGVKVLERIQIANERLETLSERIASRLEKLKAEGVDTSKAELVKAEVDTQIANTYTQIESVLEEARNIKDSENPRDVAQKIKEMTKEIADMVRNSQQGLKDVISALK